MENFNDIEKVAEFFKALSNPYRLCIIRGLIDNACNVKKMTHCMQMPQSTVSQHLSKLKAAGLIYGERKGNEICYHIKDDRVIEMIRIFFGD